MRKGQVKRCWVSDDVQGGYMVPDHIAKPLLAHVCKADDARRAWRRRAIVKLAVWAVLQSLLLAVLVDGWLSFLLLILYGVSSAGVSIVLLRLRGRHPTASPLSYTARWGKGVEMKRVKKVFLASLVIFAGLLTAFVFACMVNQGEWAVAIQALVPWVMLVGYYAAYTRAYQRTRRATMDAEDMVVTPGVIEIKKALSPDEVERLTQVWTDTMQ